VDCRGRDKGSKPLETEIIQGLEAAKAPEEKRSILEERRDEDGQPSDLQK
jgi:hypothetical protein